MVFDGFQRASNMALSPISMADVAILPRICSPRSTLLCRAKLPETIEAAVDVAPRNSPSASGSIFFSFSEDQTLYNESSA